MSRTFAKPKSLWLTIAISILISGSATTLSGQQKNDDPESKPVSFYSDIRPIIQQKCYGCHQGAKQDGKYVMTEFSKLLGGGETGSTAVVPHQPDDSYLMELIAPSDGEAEMPRDAKPLQPAKIKLIRRWIKEGAKNDTPAHAGVLFTKHNPPQYKLLPTVTSLDCSPNGELIAVAGFHEVVLHKLSVEAETGKLSTQKVARLVGLSERIESVKFSPDGKQLAVCGGSPARMGEIQIWDVGKQELLRSKQVGYDTLYGASWSRDGKLIAFGCPDTTVRSIKSETGEQVLFNGAHNDWVRDTVFSTKNDHLITVSRDMSMKLIKVDTQRFVDNITSITPGALKGGLNAVDCHPAKDELLSGGADGIPRVYRMLRTKARKIGDDFNLIRAYGKLDGRLFDTCFDSSGKHIGAVSSFNGKGQLKVFETDSGKEIVKVDHADGGWFAIDFVDNKNLVVVSGFDGLIRIYDLQGKPKLQFDSVPLAKPTKQNETD